MDGVVGKNTVSALKAYQFPAETSEKTDKINLGDRVLKKGMKGTDVTQLKNILIDKKFISDAFAKGESFFTEEIEKAVILFQKSIEIDADGIVEAQTVYFLKKQK